MGTKAVIIKFITGTDWLLRVTFQLPREGTGKKKGKRSIYGPLQL